MLVRPSESALQVFTLLSCILLTDVAAVFLFIVCLPITCSAHFCCLLSVSACEPSNIRGRTRVKSRFTERVIGAQLRTLKVDKPTKYYVTAVGLEAHFILLLLIYSMRNRRSPFTDTIVTAV